MLGTLSVENKICLWRMKGFCIYIFGERTLQAEITSELHNTEIAGVATYFSLVFLN